MTKNPILNSLAAVSYITIVATLMSNGERIFGKVDTMIIPIAMLSLFVLSASIMGYIFCFEPLKMFLEGQQKEAVNLFLKTVASMAVITALVFIIAFLAR
jgi:hypothetical protein